MGLAAPPPRSRQSQARHDRHQAGEDGVKTPMAVLAWLRPLYVHRQIQGPLAKQLSLLGLDMLLWFFLT
jgi:hypothetical protein